MLRSLKGLPQWKLARNASWIVLGQGASFLLQAGTFILLARLLGVSEYGIFSGAFALVTVVAPYSTLGAGLLFLRYVSLDRSQAGLYWGNALLISLTMSSLIALLLWFAGPLLTGQPNGLLFAVLVFANCFFFQVVAIAGQVFQTFDNLRMTAILSLLTNFSRLVILVIMELTLHRANAFQWAVGVLISSMATAALAWLCVRSEFGLTIRFDARLILRRAWEGLGFSFAGTTQAAYNDIDKTMLSHYGLNRENGFYTLAYRIVEFATAPITAMDVALLPRYFVLSQEGMLPVVRRVAKSLRVGVAVGVGIVGATLLLAPLVPHMVGRDFSGVLIALRWLCWMPLLRSVHRLTGIALTGTGNQRLRTVAQFIVAAVNLGLNFWWIPVYGWIGAAWSSVASDGLLGLLNSGFLYWVWKRSPTPVILEPETVGVRG